METFDWSNSIEIDGSEFPEDTLQRAQYANFLTHFLSSEGQRRNFVLNLNAEWGSGKTYFLKRWAEELKRRHPVVYIDAWSQDFSEDPLLTTVSSMIDQLQKQTNSSTDQLIIKTRKAAGNLFKKTAPLIIESLIRKYIADPTEIIGSLGQEETNSSFDFNQSKIAEKLAEGLIKDHETKLSSITGFQESITTWINTITSSDSKEKPAFIFIDELDRCRPTYAIEMLETIKHLYSMKDVVFVIATDTRQLQHSIKVVYGAEFDADKYLGRFFNRRLTLKPPKHINFIRNLPQYNHLNELLNNSWNVMPYYQDSEEILTIFSGFFSYYQLNLRTTERIIDQLLSILQVVKINDKSSNLILLTALLCWKECDFDFYQAVCDDKIKLNNASQIDSHTPNKYQTHRINFKINLKFYSGGFQISFPESNGTNQATIKEAPVNEILHFLYISLTEGKQTPKITKQIKESSDNAGANHNQLVSIIIEANEPSKIQLTWDEYIDLVELATTMDG